MRLEPCIRRSAARWTFSHVSLVDIISAVLVKIGCEERRQWLEDLPL